MWTQSSTSPRRAATSSQSSDFGGFDTGRQPLNLLTHSRGHISNAGIEFLRVSGLPPNVRRCLKEQHILNRRSARVEARNHILFRLVVGTRSEVTEEVNRICVIDVAFSLQCQRQSGVDNRPDLRRIDASHARVDRLYYVPFSVNILGGHVRVADGDVNEMASINRAQSRSDLREGIPSAFQKSEFSFRA